MTLNMPAITFLALLNEGNKLKVYDLKQAISVATYPYMDEDAQKEFQSSLVLPDDILSDIIIEETSETEKQDFKKALEDGN